MSFADIPAILLAYQERERAAQRTGLSACLCIRCGDWSEIGSNYCEWCRIVEVESERTFWQRITGSRNGGG